MDQDSELRAWAQARNVSANTAAQSAIYDLPGKVFELADTGDLRGIPLLRRALQSRNYMIAVWAAKGLVQIQDKDLIPLIIAACQRATTGYASEIAKSLIWFDDPLGTNRRRYLCAEGTRQNMARRKGAGDGGFRLAKDKSGSNTVARHAAPHEKITCPRNRLERSRWRGGHCLRGAASGGGCGRLSHKEGDPCDQFTQEDAGRTPAAQLFRAYDPWLSASRRAVCRTLWKIPRTSSGQTNSEAIRPICSRSASWRWEAWWPASPRCGSFVRTLKRREFREELPYPKSDRRLPTVLSLEEVARLIDAAGNLMQRALLMTLYGTGMRRTEVSLLKVSDIDSRRMMIRVEARQGRRRSRYPTQPGTAGDAARVLAMEEASHLPFSQQHGPPRSGQTHVGQGRLVCL